nr:MAG TPA: lytic transglycosylase [Bacteriophage sp.]
MKNNEELRMFGEISLVIVLVLAVLDLLVIGVARAVSASTETTEASAQNVQSAPLSVDCSYFQNDIEAKRMPMTRELECEIVPLETEHPEMGQNDLDELRGFDGVLRECTVTYYCCEKRPHICGGGTGKTATGTDVTAGRSAAVDPNVIPLGAEILVDYGDGVLHSYIAEDTGSAVLGGHIDLAVQTHEEALALGTAVATVWWIE